MSPYVERLIDGRLNGLLGEFPAVSVVGPRACGKTTTARRHARVIARSGPPRGSRAFPCRPTAFLDTLADGQPATIESASPFTITDYVDMAIHGGLPQPTLLLSGRGPADWLAAYADHVVERDAPAHFGHRDPQLFRRMLTAVAANTAGVPTALTLAEAAGIDRRTVGSYLSRLADLFVVEQVPAWASNRLSRLTSAPKLFVTDPSLVGALLGLDRQAILRNGDLLGRIIETFVFAQLRAELPVASSRPRLHHLRNRDGRGIDVVVEFADGTIAAIEVKASAAATRRDARHLIWLRDQVADRFAGGVVLHTGPHAFQLDEQIWALPIGSLWG
ncbi:MAG: DUF4143 domain-containing protein [Tetrasphaera sp.]